MTTRIIPNAHMDPMRRSLGRPMPQPLAAVESVPHALPDPAILAAEREREASIERERIAAELEQAVAAAIEAHERSTAQSRDEARECAVREGRAAGMIEGREAGHLEALREARDALRERVEKLDALAASIEERRDAALVACEADAIAIGFAAAARLLGDALVTPEGVRAAVLETLRLAKHGEELRVAVSPADLERLNALSGASAFEGHRVSLYADSSLSMGGCRVESGAGILEARIDRQLDTLKAALLAAQAVPEVRP